MSDQSETRAAAERYLNADVYWGKHGMTEGTGKAVARICRAYLALTSELGDASDIEYVRNRLTSRDDEDRDTISIRDLIDEATNKGDFFPASEIKRKDQQIAELNRCIELNNELIESPNMPSEPATPVDAATIVDHVLLNLGDRPLFDLGSLDAPAYRYLRASLIETVQRVLDGGGDSAE